METLTTVLQRSKVQPMYRIDVCWDIYGLKLQRDFCSRSRSPAPRQLKQFVFSVTTCSVNLVPINLLNIYVLGFGKQASQQEVVFSQCIER